MPEFLLEVGCEEIPAGWLRAVTDELRDRFATLAAANHLDPQIVEGHSTPRRLVVRAAIASRQPNRMDKIRGPSLEIAKDATGKWTKAAEGFARRHGATTAELVEDVDSSVPLPLPQKVYVWVHKPVTGEAAERILPQVVPELLRALSFPKRMNWDAWLDDGKGAFPFGRPIRWLIMLLDGVVVPMEIYALVDASKGGVVVRSGDMTYGHRFFPRTSAPANDDMDIRRIAIAGIDSDDRGGQTIRVSSFEDLLRKLRERFVVLSRSERAAKIREALSVVQHEVSSDHGLLDTWADLVEHPAVVIGRIPSEFQSLPREVLETVLVHHQKYIPLSADGRTVSRFAAVTDTDGADAAAIARGMERVVVARLRDAAFFFTEDQKRLLHDRVPDLAGVTFHLKLGSYKKKAERIGRLAFVMGAQLGYLSQSEVELAQEAAHLCKADLTTLMVREFPELQGSMGGIYLRLERRPEIVAKAVQWHYHPLSVGVTDLPAGHLTPEEARIFAAISLADKLDTLVGYFGMGEDPTGSRDPYGLRRAAQGAIRVLLDFWESEVVDCPSLSVLIEEAIKGYRNSLSVDLAKLPGYLELFLLERLAYVLEMRGFPRDEINAVLEPDDKGPGPAFAKGPLKVQALENVRDAYRRLKALHEVRAAAPEAFASLAIAFKRAKNILEQPKGVERAPEVRPELFEGDAERALYDAVESLGGQDGNYEARLRALATLREPVDRFFDPERGVFVMTDDAQRRGNRLALLEQMRRLFYRIADISKLGG